MAAAHSRPNVRTIFDGLQSQLEGELQGHRHATLHPTARGEASENAWLKLLQEHLPLRYQADRAFVIDAHGGCSDQIDIVIYDRQYSPFLYNKANVRYLPAESVYAVLEVKQALNAEHLCYAAQKAASVRLLQRSPGRIWHLNGEDESKPLTPVLAGFLCYESDWSPPFGEPFKRCINDLNNDHQLSIGCSLRHGAFEVAEPMAPTIIEDGRPLLQFLMRLLKQLQPLGSAPAINYQAYLSHLEQAPGE